MKTGTQHIKTLGISINNHFVMECKTQKELINVTFQMEDALSKQLVKTTAILSTLTDNKRAYYLRVDFSLNDDWINDKATISEYDVMFERYNFDTKITDNKNTVFYERKTMENPISNLVCYQFYTSFEDFQDYSLFLNDRELETTLF